MLHISLKDDTLEKSLTLEKMINVTKHQGGTNQNYSVMFSHIH